MSQSRGVYRKYEVRRTDGSSSPGRKHEACDYFVLDLDHDPFALPALREYARACAEAFPELAADLRAKCGVMADTDMTAAEMRDSICRMGRGLAPDPWSDLPEQTSTDGR